MNAAFTITADTASLTVATKMALLQPARLARIVGPAMRESWRDALKALPGNRRGWPSTRFWERASRSVRQPEYTGDGVTLTAEQQGLRQRWLGGTITARNKALTIPISPEAYGKTASQVPGLFLMVTQKGAYLVRNTGDMGGGFAHKARKGVKQRRGTLQFLFKLISKGSSITQKGNPAVVPTDRLQQAAHDRLAEVLK